MSDDLMREIAEPLVESMVLDGSLDSIVAEHTANLYAEPEWATPRYVHQATLLRCFVHGVLTADPWYHGYRLPPHFEGVVNMVAFEIQRRWPTEVPLVSLAEFEMFLREICPRHPEFEKWNETPKMFGLTSRDSEMATERDFIDLDALYRNASVALRDDRRRNDAFEREFERQQQERPL